MVKKVVIISISLFLFLISLYATPIFGDTHVREEVFSSFALSELDSLSSSDHREVIVQFDEDVKEKDLALLSALDFENIYTYHVLPAVFVKGTVDSIKTLSGYPRVLRIDLNSDIEIDMEMSLSVINATRAWNREILGSSKHSNIDGTGVTAVVVDTGIDAGHPDMDYGEKTIMNLFLNREEGYTWVEMENTDFDYGHGTHVAGTVAGNGDASAGARRGVAPGANLIGLTLVDPTVADYLISLEWVYDHSRPNANPYNIRLATNSWHVEDQQHGVYDPDSPLTQIIEKLAFENNVVSTWSAGNHGRDDPEGEQGLTSPQGNTPVAIMCAAYERDGSAVTDFSSKGMRGLNHTYPDIGAPGRSIWSAHARRTVISAGSKMGGNPNPYYLAISGTSMSTPHVAGLVALLWQAAPSLTIRERHEDYSGDDDSWWENPNTRIHEIEWIMEATATYLEPSEETGVPKEDNITGMDGRPMDYCQGYGIVNAEEAVAVALTLQRLRRMYPEKDITVADALRSFKDMMVEVNVSEKTNILSVSWDGEYSRYNDQFGRSLTEVNQTKNIFVPEGVERVIIDLAYDPIDASEMTTGDLTYTIDYDNDGNADVTGGMEPVLSGNRHEEIDVDVSQTNSLWAFGIVGQGFKAQNPIRENSYVELRIEYSMSVQLVLGASDGELQYIEFKEDNSMIAPLRFGSPGPGYDGDEVAMPVNYYDLDAVEYKEIIKKSPKKEEGDPLLLLIPIVLILALIMGYFAKKRGWLKKHGV
ncbi:MAG: S8 family serine peptidase [Methanomassiliicoccales archaeon]|nr:MAG: S8 family serine peptidase [Methanomassiliicoccales archaeon]